jgi:hypothetical protein
MFHVVDADVFHFLNSSQSAPYLCGIPCSQYGLQGLQVLKRPPQVLPAPLLRAVEVRQALLQLAEL